MLAEKALRKLVPRRSAERGDEYFVQGRVRKFHEENGVIEATVLGERPYSVSLILADDIMTVECDCPFFAREGETCKHIWAVIRTASAKGVLPERDLVILPEETEVEYFDNVTPIRRPSAPAWQRFLQALGPATQHLSRAARNNVPDEIAYLLGTSSTAQSLSLRVVGRSRKKSGEWGKWKAPLLQPDDLAALDPFDRETISLLQQRAFGVGVETTIFVSPPTAAWWIERLARAGRLYIATTMDDLQPIAWDDGPPWTFRARVTGDMRTSKYRITGSIEREGESLPLEAVNALANGILISDHRASRFDDRGATAWLHALRASGTVEVPFRDADQFRNALLGAPIAGVDLPPELGWEVVDAEPRPLFSMQHDAWGSELAGELFFLYDDWRVSSRSREVQATNGRKLIRRDPAAESKYLARLGAIAGVVKMWDGYRVRLQILENLARTLVQEGWAVEIDASPLRVADSFDVELSSGIDWFDLSVHASFGETKLTLPDLLAAADAKRELLRLKDGSFGIVPAQLMESLTPVIELGKRDGDSVRFRASQALLVDALLTARGQAVTPLETPLRHLAEKPPAPMQEPSTLKAELRPYQRAGLGWLHFLREARIGGCLADDMGLGKTVQTLALLESIRDKRPSLVVAPRSLLFNWAAEAARFAPELRVREHHGAERTKSAEAFADCDLVLTTYATMRLDIAHLAGIDFEYVILDEAQAIKNATSQVAKASRLLRGNHRLALSGTPIENHLGELWSLFEFLNPGLLGSARTFQRTFASKTTPPERREALARALRPLILRRTKEQVAPELPERTEQTLYCELEGEQRREYDELREHYRVSLLGRVRDGGVEKSRMLILEALLRLRQAACHPALIDPESESPSAKMDLLLDELQDVLASGHRALIFSQFTSFLAIVRKSLDKQRVPYLYLDGKTRDRQSLVEQFQSDGGPPLFLISLKAGGLGLNLTNADYIFLLDPWWNPAVEAQAIDRAHRIGRMRPVVAHRLIARDTVEEKILELQARKRELAESIISEDNSVLRKLEVEDLELLLS